MWQQLQPLMTRFYEKHGDRYMLVVLLTIALVGTFATAMGSLAFALFLSAPWQKTLEWMWILQVLNLVSLVATYVFGFRLFRPVSRWMGGSKSHLAARSVWEALGGSFPGVVARGYVAYSVVFLIALPVAGAIFDIPGYGFPLIFLGIELVISFAAGLDALTWDWAFRPVLVELDEILGAEDFQPHVTPGTSLRIRVLAAPILSAPLIAIITVGAITSIRGAPMARFGLAMAISVAVSLFLGVITSALSARAVLEPINALVGAIRKVESGDLNVTLPIVSMDEFGELTGAFNGMVRGLAETEAVRVALGAYVDPEVAHRIVKEGMLLEGREVEVTIMVLDIRDFTTFSERSSPSRVVALLNELWEIVIPILHEHQGHANKFVGDAVLGVFGAPQPVADHANKAIEAASAICAALKERFEGRIRIGIGLNSGVVVAGTLGGGGRLEFTVIGDAVNVASRVQDLTKETQFTILLTEATRALLSTPPLGLEPLGLVPIRGKTQPVQLFGCEPSQVRSDLSPLV